MAWRWNGGVDLGISHQGGADHPSAMEARNGSCGCGDRTGRHWVEYDDDEDVNMGLYYRQYIEKKSGTYEIQ